MHLAAKYREWHAGGGGGSASIFKQNILPIQIAQTDILSLLLIQCLPMHINLDLLEIRL